MARFILVDTLNLFMRASHVTRGDAYEKAGLALSIAINSVKWAYQKFEGDHIVFLLEGHSWRKDVYKPYKANRAVKRLEKSQTEIEEDRIFFDTLNDFVTYIRDHTNCTVLKHSKCEADDLIARWIQIFGQDSNNHFTIVSTDTDFAQLLAPNVQIYDGVNKTIYRDTGVFDEKFKPKSDKKGKLLEALNPEYVLFEKCIRGDSSDNIASAYPGVRSKGSSKKAGIEEAFADRDNQGFVWVNFFKSTWEDPDGNVHVVEKDYERNKLLIDLTQQPQDIKDALDETILTTLETPKSNRMIGASFLKFCGRHELKRLAEHPEPIVEMFSSGFDRVLSLE